MTEDLDRLDALAADEGWHVLGRVSITAQELKELVAAVRERDELRAAAELAMETIGWTQGFCVGEEGVYETWFRGVDPAMTALRAALHREDGA